MAVSYNIPVINKTFAVIKCISGHEEGLTLSEIVKKIEAPKTTVFKILHTLEQELIVERKKDRYFLGSMLIHLGLQTLYQRDLKAVANKFLRNLTDITSETSHIAVPVGMQSMILDVVHSPRHLRFSAPAGSIFPMYCTSHGKVFLSFTHDFSIEEYLLQVDLYPRTSNTIITDERLKNEITNIQEKGFAIDETEFVDEVRCCAAPVFDNMNRCIAAVGVTSTVINFKKARIPEISSAVCNIALKISVEMGYKS